MFGSRIWNFWAPRYQRLLAQHFALGPTRRLVLDHLSTTLPDVRRVLDLGCGVGQLARELVDRFPEAQVIAFDSSPGMIEHAIRHNSHPRVRYLVATLEEIDTDEPFDAVIATHAFPYLPDKQGALARIHRILRPGGRLLVVQGNVENSYDAIFYVFVSLTVSRAQYLSTQTLRAMMERACFAPGVRLALPRLFFIPSVYLVEGIRRAPGVMQPGQDKRAAKR
jgi:trans-aconitate methyltransferase